MVFAKYVNSSYVTLMGPGTCDRFICTGSAKQQSCKTSGGTTIVIEMRKVETLGTIGFANIPHIDSCDKLPKPQEDSIMNDEDELGGSKQYAKI